MPPSLPLPESLMAWREGDPGALDAIVTELYDFLRSRAHQSLRRERQGLLFQTTELAHELYIKLREMKNVPASAVNDERTYFIRLSARLMRHILVDYVRETGSIKRGGSVQHVALEILDLPEKEKRTLDILVVDEALTRLEILDPKLTELVEQRFFLGMTEDEVAEARGVHKRSVQREWALAKRFLAHALSDTYRPETSHD